MLFIYLATKKAKVMQSTEQVGEQEDMRMYQMFQQFMKQAKEAAAKEEKRSETPEVLE